MVKKERRKPQITAESIFYFMVGFLLLVNCGVGSWSFGFVLGFSAQPVWFAATNERELEEP